MAVDEGLVAWVEEATAPLGRLTRRAMMGGATLYCDGIVFAILALDALWFKADAESDAAWGRGGLRTVQLHVRRRAGRHDELPPRADDCYDDADALRRWAALALAAGKRAPARAKRRRRAPPVEG